MHYLFVSSPERLTMKCWNIMICSLIICGFSVFCIGCQLTPKITNYSTTAEVVLPENRIQEEITLDDDIALAIDADVEATSTRLPVGEYESIEITVDLTRKVYAALCGDTKPLRYVETAKELTDYVLFEREQARYAKGLVSDEGYMSEMAFIDHVLEAASTAPTTQSEANLDDIFSYPDTLVEIDMGKNYQAVFKVLNGERKAFTYGNTGRKINKNELKSVEVPITASEAISQAGEVLDALGLADDFALINLDIKAMDYSIWSIYFADNTKDQAYHLVYLRKINGLPQLDGERILSGVNSDYDLDFLQEYIEMTIDDAGVLYFTWMEPGEIVVKSDAAEMIAFEEALEQMKQHVRQSYNRYTFPDMDCTNITVRVSKIMLGCICVEMPGRVAGIVPAWEFYGYVEYDDGKSAPLYYNRDLQVWDQSNAENASVCTINALDGSVIDRSRGY